MSGTDPVLGAEVEHLLGLADAADRRAGEGSALQQQREHRDGQRLGRRADVHERAVGLQQPEEPPDLELGADGVDDEVEAPGELLESLVVAGGVVAVGAEPEPVVLLAQRSATGP